MTRQEAEEVAREMRTVGWETVWVEIDDNGEWKAVAVDWDARDGWLHRQTARSQTINPDLPPDGIG